MIENLLESVVFEKVGKQKYHIFTIFHKRKHKILKNNSTKIWSDCWRCLIDLIWFFLEKPWLFHTTPPIIYIQVYATFSSKKKEKFYATLVYIGQFTS